VARCYLFLLGAFSGLLGYDEGRIGLDPWMGLGRWKELKATRSSPNGEGVKDHAAEGTIGALPQKKGRSSGERPVKTINFEGVRLRRRLISESSRQPVSCPSSTFSLPCRILHVDFGCPCGLHYMLHFACQTG